MTPPAFTAPMDDNAVDDAAMNELHTLLETLVGIGAPTFREEARGRFIESWLREHVDAFSGRDELGNVWVDLSGGADDVHLLDAHMDTVFPFESVAVRKEGATWHAPGVIDNTATCAILMLWLKQTARRASPSPFLATFTVGEENEGNLRGIKKIVTDFGPRLRDACVLDLRLDVGCRENVGSSRCTLRWQAQGGHSWNDFGRPSAVHAMAKWIHELDTAFVWKPQMRSYNVGSVEGGQGATSIAESASLKLDVRSTEPAFLRDFGTWMEEQLDAAGEGLVLTRHGVLERPAGSTDPEHVLVRALGAVHRDMDLELSWDVYSTNANALCAAGIPAITTGLTRGRGIHTEAEFLETPSLALGVQKLALLAAKLRETK